VTPTALGIIFAVFSLVIPLTDSMGISIYGEKDYKKTNNMDLMAWLCELITLFVSIALKVKVIKKREACPIHNFTLETFFLINNKLYRCFSRLKSVYF